MKVQGAQAMDDFITICKQRAIDAQDRFLLNLHLIPEDKLHWKPSPTAKSAFEIAAHCAGYSSAFARIISAAGFPWPVDEFRSRVNGDIQSVKTVAQADAMLRQGIQESLAALDAVPHEKIDKCVTTPQGEVPFTFFLELPGFHLIGHEGQLSYLQTCWDDQVVHF